MPKPVQPPESFVDLKFPLAGIDLSRGFGQQPMRPMPDGSQTSTTPTGQNVRAFDVFTQRARGGSRPGLARYVDDQINGTALVQEINPVVGVGFSAPGKGAGGTSGAVVAQTKTFGTQISSSTVVVTFTSAVTAGNAIVVMINGNQSIEPTTVADNKGNTYTRAIGNSPNNVSVSIWYCLATVTGGSSFTVTATFAIGIQLGTMVALEVSGLTALDDTNANNATSGTTATSGAIATTSYYSLIVGCMQTNGNGGPDVVSPAGYTNPLKFGGSFPGDYVYKVANDLVSENLSWTIPGPNGWVAAVASFKASSTGGNAVQSSQSGRIVTLVGVSGGTVKVLPAGGTVWGSVTSGSAALATTGVIRSTSLNQKIYFADGAHWKYYDPSDNAMHALTASAGSLPGSNLSPVEYPRLICNWRSRLVVSGLTGDPQNWFMSALGDPTNWNYFPIPVVSTQAVAGNNSPLGTVGDTITCLIPYTDDMLIFGGDHTIYLLRGDPMAGGSIDLVSSTIGMAFGNPWCKGPDGTLYFVSNKMGVYNMQPGQGLPIRMSQPIEQLINTVDSGLYGIIMTWDDVWQGFHLYITLLSAAADTTHFFWEQRTGAWWNDVFANTNHNPLCCVTFDGNTSNDRRALIGSWDGYVRTYSPTATNDDGTAISSSVVLGPLLTKDFDDVLWKSVQAVLATASGSVTYAVYTGATAEAALASTPVISGTWSAGRNQTNHLRRSGHALWIAMSSTDQFALEGIRACVQGSGKVRRRGV